jgi:hypothetical protein
MGTLGKDRNILHAEWIQNDHYDQCTDLLLFSFLGIFPLLNCLRFLYVKLNAESIQD